MRVHPPFEKMSYKLRYISRLCSVLIHPISDLHVPSCVEISATISIHLIVHPIDGEDLSISASASHWNCIDVSVSSKRQKSACNAGLNSGELCTRRILGDS